MKKKTEAEKFLDEMIKQKRQLEREIEKIENEIFKYETGLLEISQEYPITKGLEYYLSNRPEKKKHVIKDEDRIFSNNFFDKDQ